MLEVVIIAVVGGVIDDGVTQYSRRLAFLASLSKV